MPPQQQQPPIPPPASLVPDGRIPSQLLQQHFSQINTARQIQQKTAVIQNALQTGVIANPPGQDPSGSTGGGTGTAGGGGGGQTRLTPQQRPLLEKQLEEAKRQAGLLMQAIHAFQTQWTPQRIQSDWQVSQSPLSFLLFSCLVMEN